MQLSPLKTLALGSALVALAWLPTPAQAQFTLNITPSAVTAMPGDLNVPISGTLTNLAGTPVDLQNENFNLLSGPNGANLGTAIIFSDMNLTNPPLPQTLGANQAYSGPLVFLDTDASAPLGTYIGNFSVQYGTQTIGQDFTIQLGTPVPEAGTLPLLALGAGFVLIAAWRRRAAA